MSAEIPPVIPDDTVTFASRDRTNLYGEVFRASAPKGGVLILHGYGDHAGRYREVAGILRELGVSVFALDYRGHGRAGGQRGHCQRFTEYLDDVDAALEEFARHPGGDGPLVVIGHSHGGLILLRLLCDAERCPKRVRAAVFSSPFLGFKLTVPPVKAMIGRFASQVFPSLSLPASLPIPHLTSDLQKQKERETDTLCHGVAGARWFTEVQATWQWLEQHVHELPVPSQWLVAGGDRIADPESTRRFRARVRSPSRYAEFEGFEHEVFNETGRAHVFARLRDFVSEQFSK